MESFNVEPPEASAEDQRYRTVIFGHRVVCVSVSAHNGLLRVSLLGTTEGAGTLDYFTVSASGSFMSTYGTDIIICSETPPVFSWQDEIPF